LFISLNKTIHDPKFETGTHMASNLQVDQNLTPKAQSVKDQKGTTSPLTLAVDQVGIGTTTPTPGTKLDVAGEVKVLSSNPIHFTSVWRGWPDGEVNAAEISNDTGPTKALVIGGNYSAGLGRRTMVLDRLDVLGFLSVLDAHLNPTIKIDGTTGNIEVAGDIRLTNADCAEDFNIGTDLFVEPGTVMVLGEEGALFPSHNAYDKRVAGVVSGAGDYKPGIVLDQQKSERNRQAIALLGKVFCKVDAQYSEIEIGDLLTTSPTPGHAMKADDPLKAFGTVIGKALRPLAEGQGLIPILIALQ
jgi:hypothetical protein